MPKVDVEVRDHEVVPDVFFGDDGPYEFVATKTGSILSAMLIQDDAESTTAQYRAQLDWLERGFDPEDWSHFQDRIADVDDALDVSHLLQMANELTSAVSKRPPTSSNGSTRTPRTNTGAAKRSPKAKTSGGSPQDDSAT